MQTFTPYVPPPPRPARCPACRGPENKIVSCGHCAYEYPPVATSELTGFEILVLIVVMLLAVGGMLVAVEYFGPLAGRILDAVGDASPWKETYR